MAFCEFKNVRIAGVAAGVLKNVVSNLDLKSGDGSISADYSPEAFVFDSAVVCDADQGSGQWNEAEVLVLRFWRRPFMGHGRI